MASHDTSKRVRQPGELVFAALFLVAAGFLFSQIGAQTQLAERTKWFAQPALWPAIGVCGMVLFGGLNAWGTARARRSPGRWAEVLFWVRALEFVAYFLAYVQLVPWLGYVPSTVVFAVLLSLRCGFRRPRTLAAAAGFAIAVSIIFRGFLQVRIPAGQLYDHLPDSVRVFALTYL